jgi:2-oxoglutarate ferredoxin oxidoreductase subunit alpha
LIRPITLWPFPTETFQEWAQRDHVKAFLTVEMSMGQMVEDVTLSIGGKKPSHFYGRTGGMVPNPADILAEIEKVRGGNA